MMKTSQDVELLGVVCAEASKERRLRYSHLAKLSKAFGPRLSRALEALREGRVKKYVFKPSGRVVWVVVGREREYIIMPTVDYCSCDDFYFRVIDGKAHLCYHLIAQRLADALERFDLIFEEDRNYDILMGEWREMQMRSSRGGKR